MKISIFFLSLLFFVTLFSVSTGQEATYLTLNETVQLAKEQSPNAVAARHQFRASYWRHRTHNASLLPQVTADATLPDFTRSIEAITLPDGSEKFTERNNAQSYLSASVIQNIGLTGGQVFMRSNLQRIDLLQDSNTTTYLSSPIVIGLSQPLFGYNSYKWSKKIEPLLYQEAERTYAESMENIARYAANYFFDLLLAEINLDVTQINLANNDTIYKIAKGRYGYGKIAENELLQMELSYLNSQNELEEAKLNLEMALFRLKSFLALSADATIRLIPPTEIPRFSIPYNDAIAMALQNRSDAMAFQRRIIEAESNLARTKSENRFNADLYALYGLTQSADVLPGAYQNPRDQQRITIGVQIPIIDWGTGKGKVKMAESNLDLVQTQIEQETVDFEQDIFLKVKKFNMQAQQVFIAAKADTIAQKRFEVTKQRYLIGKIDITDFNIARSEKDMARRNYIAQLRTFWTSLFEIRAMTLYDFLNDRQIFYELDDLLQ